MSPINAVKLNLLHYPRYSPPEYWGDRKGINISVAPESLIEQIVLHPMAGVEVTARVRELVVTYGYDLPIVTSRLSEPPIF